MTLSETVIVLILLSSTQIGFSEDVNAHQNLTFIEHTSGNSSFSANVSENQTISSILKINEIIPAALPLNEAILSTLTLNSTISSGLPVQKTNLSTSALNETFVENINEFNITTLNKNVLNESVPGYPLAERARPFSVVNEVTNTGGENEQIYQVQNSSDLAKEAGIDPQLTLQRHNETSTVDDLQQKGDICDFSPPSFGLGCKALPVFDPRKESCLYLHYGVCDQADLSPMTGKECFLFCSKENQTQEALSNTQEEESKEISEDAMFAFSEISHLSTDVWNEFDSDVFDVLFEMRTHSSRANILAIFESGKDASEIENSFNLVLKNGKFGVDIFCNGWKKSFLMDIGGIQEGSWHTYYVLVNEAKGEILAQVDMRRQTFQTPFLSKKSDSFCSFFRPDTKSKIWIGDTQGRRRETTDCFLGNSFVGCLANLSLYHSSTFQQLTSKNMTNEVSAINVVMKDQCIDSMIPKYLPSEECSPSSRLERVFSASSCEASNQSHIPIVSLTGGEYLSYRQYDWSERLHTFTNKLSFSFKTEQNDVILFYASGESLDSSKDIQFLTLELTDSDQLHLRMNLGGETVSLKFGENLTNNTWHQAFILHERDQVRVGVDEFSKTIKNINSSENYFFYFDPVVFIGGVPNLNKDCAIPPFRSESSLPGCETETASDFFFYSPKEGGCRNSTFHGCARHKNYFSKVETCLEECHINGLHSYNFFSGCLKDVEFNGFRIIEELLQEGWRVQHHGVMPEVPVGCECKMEAKPPISFTTDESNLELHRSPEARSFSFELEFMSEGNRGTLASGTVRYLDSDYDWELNLVEDRVVFVIPIDFVNLTLPLEKSGSWQKVHLRSDGKRVSISVKDEQTSSTFLEENIIFRDTLEIGWPKKEAVLGFIGCIRGITLDQIALDLRTFVGSSLASNDVIMDNCQVLSPCHQRDSCGEVSQCLTLHSRPICTCAGSAFEGPNCRISKFRKSCEEYRVLGYNKSGHFVVDMDETGPLPPAAVFCQFDKDGKTFTHVEHNVPRSFSNENVNTNSFMMTVAYRDFNNEMLRRLIDESEHCRQDIRFSCGYESTPYKSAWYSSVWYNHIEYLGPEAFGKCHCKGYEECDSDLNDNANEQLSGFTIRNKKYLPVKATTFARGQNEFLPHLEPNMSLGQLICEAKVRKEKSVWFESPESHMILPPWTHGQLRFRFRTTTKTGNILYQPSFNRNNPSFQIGLLSSNAIEFTYSFKKEERKVEFETSRSISSGEWNLVWVDSFAGFFRIAFNDQVKTMDLPSGYDHQMLDGILIFGNVLNVYQQNANSFANSGFTGCVGNLNVNSEEMNLHEAASSTESHGVLQGCQAHCDLNPCQNRASCIELWSSYQCLCENPFAHLGDNCEIDINEHSLSFTASDPEAAYFNSQLASEDINPLRANFTFNFQTSQSEALVFVAKDYVQNIIQVYLRAENEVVVYFNYGNELTQIVVNTMDVSLNEGQSVQLAVERLRDETSVQVLTRGQLFSSSVSKGLLQLTEDEYQQFPYEVLPHLVQYQHSFTVPGKYYLIFVGGARSFGTTSDLPSLVGCFRGLKIGAKVVDFGETSAWSFGNGVQRGCFPACDQEKNICKNGGSCINKFSDGNDNFSCNCINTSYIGETCAKEVAYTFNGREDGIAQPGWTLRFEQRFEISFAFAPEQNSKEKELLLYIPLLSNTGLETGHFVVFLHGLNLLKLELHVDVDFSSTFELISQDSANRHFVQVEYDSQEGMGVVFMADGNNLKVFSETNKASRDPPRNESLGLLIGGVGETPANQSRLLADVTNFSGCISNLHVLSEETDMWPLEEYENGKFIRFGLPKLGSCSVFSKTKMGSARYDFSKVAEWNYKPEPEVVAVDLSFEEPDDNLEYEAETYEIRTTQLPPAPLTAKIWPWALLGSLLFMVVLTVVVFALNVCYKKQTQTERQLADAEFAIVSSRAKGKEEIPLLDKEPARGNRKQQEASTLPYELAPSSTPSDNIQNDEMKKANDAVLLQTANETESQSVQRKEETSTTSPKQDVKPATNKKQESKPTPAPLNDIDRKSVSKQSLHYDSSFANSQLSDSGHPKTNPHAKETNFIKRHKVYVTTSVTAEPQRPTVYQLPGQMNVRKTVSAPLDSNSMGSQKSLPPSQNFQSSSNDNNSSTREQRVSDSSTISLKSLDKKAKEVERSPTFARSKTMIQKSNPNLEIRLDKDNPQHTSTKSEPSLHRSVSSLESLIQLTPWTIRKIIPWHTSGRSNNE